MKTAARLPVRLVLRTRGRGLIAGCALPSRTQQETGVPPNASISTPIIFVHGNGDTAALWHTMIWRFESNGYSRDRLFAIDFRYPQARSDDAVPMEGRSSSADQMRELATFVDEVRAKTHAGQGGAGRLVARREHGAQLHPQRRRSHGCRTRAGRRP